MLRVIEIDFISTTKVRLGERQSRFRELLQQPSELPIVIDYHQRRMRHGEPLERPGRWYCWVFIAPLGELRFHTCYGQTVSCDFFDSFFFSKRESNSLHHLLSLTSFAVPSTASASFGCQAVRLLLPGLRKVFDALHTALNIFAFLHERERSLSIRVHLPSPNFSGVVSSVVSNLLFSISFLCFFFTAIAFFSLLQPLR